MVKILENNTNFETDDAYLSYLVAPTSLRAVSLSRMKIEEIVWSSTCTLLFVIIHFLRKWQ